MAATAPLTPMLPAKLRAISSASTSAYDLVDLPSRHAGHAVVRWPIPGAPAGHRLVRRRPRLRPGDRMPGAARLRRGQAALARAAAPRPAPGLAAGRRRAHLRR